MRPQSTKVIVRRTESKKVSDGGLDIPESQHERPAEGVVVAVGSKVTEWQVGDTVIFPIHVGFDVPGMPDHLIMFEDDIWAAL